jgi:hypothetical protein
MHRLEGAFLAVSGKVLEIGIKCDKFSFQSEDAVDDYEPYNADA